MDGALEHMRQFGFCDQLVRKTVRAPESGFSFICFFVFAKARTFMGSSPSFCHKKGVFYVRLMEMIGGTSLKVIRSRF